MYNMKNIDITNNVNIAIEWANANIYATKDGGTVLFMMYEGATKKELYIIKSIISSNRRVETSNINAQYASITLKERVAKAA